MIQIIIAECLSEMLKTGHVWC